jgi:hypothetical protein
MNVTETQYTLAMQRHGTPEFTDEDRKVQEQWLKQREEEQAMTIRATDDEALAEQLWGDDKKWDDERRQFVPTKDENGVQLVDLGRVPAGNVGETGLELRPGTEDVEAEPSHGNKSARLSDETVSSGSKSSDSPQPTAPTTEATSSQGRTGSSTARSTGGPGKDKPASSSNKN